MGKENCEKSICLVPAGTQIYCGFGMYVLITKVQAVVSLGSEFWPTTRDTFSNRETYLSREV